MSGLSPERRAQLAQLLYVNQAAQGEHFGTEGPWWDDADILAPLIADMLAAEREAGAAEVRARVAAWWTDFFGCRLDSCNCRDARDLRSYLNRGER